MAIHPTQLYGALSAALILVILVMVERRKMTQGTLFALFMFLYGTLRALTDLARLPSPKTALIWVQPFNQGLNICIAAIGLLIAWKIFRGTRDKKIVNSNA